MERFLEARNGDSLAIPFQCDVCWFINIEKRTPLDDGYSDQRLLSYIRRVNLDIMWCREGNTLDGLLTNLRKGKRMSEALNLSPVSLPLGPWPIEDTQGFQIALEIIRASQETGRNDVEYQQYDTIRKIRSTYSAIFESGPRMAKVGLTFKGDKGRMVHFTDSPLNCLLFRQFMTGLEKRMGRLVCQDLALDVRALIFMLQRMESEIRSADTTWERKRFLSMCGGAFVCLYAGALRGGEVFLIEGKELCKRIQDGKHDSRGSHVYVPLMGRFKHETGERNLMFAFVSVSENSNLRIRVWLERIVFILKDEGKDKVVGPAICDASGYAMVAWKVNQELHRQLEIIRRDRVGLIDRDIDIEEKFSIFRSFRRGATTRAKEMGVQDSTISMNNRWRKSQNSAGGLPRLPMSDLYTEIQQALLTRLRFSRSL